MSKPVKIPVHRTLPEVLKELKQVKEENEVLKAFARDIIKALEKK